MKQIFYDMVEYFSGLIYPLNEMVSHLLAVEITSVVLVTVSMVATYLSLTDKYSYKFNKARIFRDIYTFMLVIVLISGMYNLLYVLLAVYIVVRIFVDIHDTGFKRFTRVIE